MNWANFCNAIIPLNSFFVKQKFQFRPFFVVFIILRGPIFLENIAAKRVTLKLLKIGPIKSGVKFEIGIKTDSESVSFVSVTKKR